jgi:hypothetical protein
MTRILSSTLKIKSISPKTYPSEYGSAQNNLGIAYYKLALNQNKEDNLKRAIHCDQEALKIYTIERYPHQLRHDPEQPWQCLLNSGRGPGQGGEPQAGHPGLRGSPQDLH